MNTYKSYLIDLVFLLKEKLEETSSRERNTVAEDKVFESGIVMGYYTALDLIKSQAIAFGIPIEEIGLKDYDLEKFLWK
jgi:hypothetical protein